MKEDDLSITWMPQDPPCTWNHPEDYALRMQRVRVQTRRIQRRKMYLSEGWVTFHTPQSCARAWIVIIKLNKPDLAAPGEHFDDEDTDTDDSGGADEEF